MEGFEPDDRHPWLGRLMRTFKCYRKNNTINFYQDYPDSLKRQSCILFEAAVSWMQQTRMLHNVIHRLPSRPLPHQHKFRTETMS